jgi:gluconolactonase
MLGLDQFSTFAEGLDHPEGVAWGPDGRIYAGGEAGQIYAVGLDGAVEQVASTGGFILGLALDSSGVVYACDTVRHEVVRVYPDGRCETHTAGTNDRPLQLPNWPVFDGDGVLYVTDSGSWHGNDGAVFRVDPRGDTTVWTTEPRQFPNGCALDITGDALYVA